MSYSTHVTGIYFERSSDLGLQPKVMKVLPILHKNILLYNMNQLCFAYLLQTALSLLNNGEASEKYHVLICRIKNGKNLPRELLCYNINAILFRVCKPT